MKILMICEFYDEHLEFQENLLAKYYTKHNHEVIVLTSTYENVFDYYASNHDNSAPGRDYNVDGVKIHKLPYKYNILNKLRPLKRVKELLEKYQPDLIYVHDISLNFPEIAQYKKQNPAVSIIMDYHADYYNSGKNWVSLKILHGVIRKYFLHTCLKQLDRVFPVVPNSADFLNEIYGVPREQMEILPLGADVDAGEEAKQSPNLAQLRQNYNIKSDEKVIITGGKLNPKKRTEDLIEAVKLVNSNVRLLVFGASSDADKAYYEDLKGRAEGYDNIIFIPWLDTKGVYEHFAISDIAVFPASQSILWQQAISMGLPLIVGELEFHDMSYLNLHDNMFVMKKEDISVEAIVDYLNKLVQDPALYAKMSEGALKVRDECLDWNSQINKTLKYSNKFNSQKEQKA